MLVILTIKVLSESHKAFWKIIKIMYTIAVVK